MARTFEQIIIETTRAYLAQLNPASLPPPEVISKELQMVVEDNILLENASRAKGAGYKMPSKLHPAQVADILLYTHRIVNISCGSEGTEECMLAVYQDSGKDEGIYSTDEAKIKKLAKQYSHIGTSQDFREVLEHLSLTASTVERTADRDLVPVNNGVFDYKAKKLLPFSPDYVFLAKCRVDYNPNAVNIIIHNDGDGTDWDVESWMESLSDDPEIVDLMWQILGAVIRPYVSWNKSAWLYSQEGNNGKGTLCRLIRNISGAGTCASIRINDFGKDFALEPLIHSSAIVVDENDVGTYVDGAANLKAVITNDTILINRKYQKMVSFQFHGFMVQCLNEFPRFKDKSNSFYRRQLFVPFSSCFEGAERKYIKDDYLSRPEVLEYVLNKVLHMNYYELSEPEACKKVLAEYKEFNDPVKQFFAEMADRFVWDLLPFSFLYELYKSWFRKNSPSGKLQGRNTFIGEIVREANSGNVWCCPDKNMNIRSEGRMEGPEPLIMEYGLEDWKNPTYIGSDTNRMSTPVLNIYYRGLQRCGTAAKEGHRDSDGPAE